jgi:sulfatase maturation enzyme AslB (radical SAM superfamily)
VKWGREEDKKYVGSDWTQNNEVWNRFLQELLKMKIQNIHFMGGETILTKRFHDFLNFMIEHKRFDLNFSFVTNGTTFDVELIKKLKLFHRVGIEVSIETITQHNGYVRQGTDTKEVLANIEKYREHCDNEKISVTIRPAPSALTIGYYNTLIEYCLEQKLAIKSNPVYKPTFLNISILPEDIKKEYLKKYYDLLRKYELESLDITLDFNESDPQQYRKIIKLAINQAIGLLNSTPPDNHSEELIKMVEHCKRWDNVYGYNATELFPELKDIFVKNGY